VFTGTAYAASWGYEGNHGPAHWGEFASECAKGQNQSPINIESATEAKLEKLNFDYEGKAISLLNNGHTLQTGLEGKNTLTIDGKEFTLKQFHFHTPSENHVDGKEYPL
ncbi:carbonic anhydrase family protein, partial [Vibrio parahaemolyticus]